MPEETEGAHQMLNVSVLLSSFHNMGEFDYIHVYSKP